MGVKVRQKNKGRRQPWWVFVAHNKRRTSRMVGDKDAAEAVVSEIRARIKLGQFSFEEDNPVSGDHDKSTQPKMSLAQKKAIFNLSRRRGISVEELEKMAVGAYAVELENLNSKDASTFIRQMQQAA